MDCTLFVKVRLSQKDQLRRAESEQRQSDLDQRKR